LNVCLKYYYTYYLKVDEWPTELKNERLDVLLSKLSFYNDNKMTHVVLLATIFFGQIQILRIVRFDSISIIKYFTYGASFMMVDLIKSLHIYDLILYYSFNTIGIYIYSRFRHYSMRSIDVVNILYKYYPDHIYPPYNTTSQKLFGGGIIKKIFDLILQYVISDYRIMIFIYVLFSSILLFLSNLP